MGNIQEYPRDVYTQTDELNRRVTRLEMSTPGPFESIGFGDGVLVSVDGTVTYTNPDGTVTVASTNPVPAPTVGTPTTATEVNTSFATVTWGVVENATRGYMIETNHVGIGVVRTDYVDFGTNTIKIAPLEPGASYFWRIWGLGPSAPGVIATTDTIQAATDSVAPNPVSGFEMFGAFKTVILRWNENTDYDMEHGKGTYEAMVDVVSTFNSGNERTWKGTATIVAFPDWPTDTVIYGRVRPVDSSGNAGDWSTTLSAQTVATATNDIGDGTLVTAHFIANTISGTVISAGSLHGDKLTANTADIAVLKTSTLNAAIITVAGTGMIRVGTNTSPFRYMLFDGSGIRAFRDGTGPFTGGTTFFDVNIPAGTVSVVGTLSTSNSGRRVILTPDGHLMLLHSGSSAEIGAAEIRNNFFGTEGTNNRAVSLHIRAPVCSGIRGGELELYGQSVDGSLPRGATLRAATGTAGSFIYVRENTLHLAGGTASQGTIGIDGPTGKIFYYGSNQGHDFAAGANVKIEVRVDRIELWENTSIRGRAIWTWVPGGVDRVLQTNESNRFGPALHGDARAYVISQQGGVLLKADSGGWVESRNLTDSGFRGMKADVFQVNSDPAIKRNMTKAANCLARLRAMRDSFIEFDYQPENDPDVEALRQRHIGVRADRVDPQIQGWGYLRDSGGEPIPTRMIDLSAEIALIGGAVTELSDLVESLLSQPIPAIPRPAAREVPAIEAIVPKATKPPKLLPAPKRQEVELPARIKESLIAR